jgi:nicotinate phosphoribosyltransferase
MQPFHVTEENNALLTDLYELTMAAAYWSAGIHGTATFELYFRRLPLQRSFVVAAGLEQAIHYICNLRFTRSQIEWLRNHEAFKDVNPGFFEYLSAFHFSGEVWAVPEGTVVFPLEPMLQVRAPLIEAQILETYLLTMLNMQSNIATKAARVVHAAKDRVVIDFGARRAHGPQAALLAARAAYISGCAGTSNVLAGYLAGIPIFGTAAHSFTMSFPTELDAFRAYHNTFPHTTTLLIDTFDTLAAARKVKEIGPSVQAVRIDSGDLVDLSRQVRKILDEDGLSSVKILASGDLNEYKIQELMNAGAPIDSFGVGTELVTSYDDPALGGVYKLVEARIKERDVGRAKTSPGKPSYPGRKQIYRFLQNGYYTHDQLCLFTERHPSGGLPLLQRYVVNGKQEQELPALEKVRSYAREEMKRLPDRYHNLTQTETYPVVFSDAFRQLADAAGKS